MRIGWARRAACADQPRELFFPVSYNNLHQIEAAKSICSGCPVKAQCLTETLAVEGAGSAKGRDGIFGATTPAERAAIVERAREAALAA